ncbi:MAG: phosphate ABC transporter substrate-binding protein [Endomicrobiaceae bacterium]|jgi:phosphate transport system substrate-binding protein|nr:phosphate ABC transporter substrate-binding protein [Endomicrobiaceae bacterium]
MKLFKSLFAVLLMITCVNSVLLAKVIVEGSTTVLPVAQRAAEEIMDSNSEIEITVRGGGSGVGINSLISKKCDIATASRSIKDSELQKASSNGVAPKAYVVAMDGIAVVVNSSNQVRKLSKAQVKGIFTGKISNWSEVGGINEKIVVVSRDSSSGTFEAFNELALNKEKVRADALMQASNQAVATTVKNTKGAIGYVGIGYVKDLSDVAIDGVKAAPETVLSNKYPYSRPLFMYTNGPAKGEAKEYLDFILSADGQALVKREGFVGLK